MALDVATFSNSAAPRLKCPDEALDSGPMRIFLVENHPDTLSCIARHLRKMGHEVETATTCAEALQKLPAQPCDLLLADIGLPDDDGWSLLEKLGAARPP